MRKSTTGLVSKLIVFVLVAFTFQLLSAQDVILIEKGIDDSGNPTLYDAIMGDTTATGERAHPNATYRLSRGQIYPVESGLRFDFDITIDALDDDPDNPVRPPMLIPKSDPQGNLDGALLWSIAENTMNLKNLMFNGVQNTIEKNLGPRGVVTKGGKTTIDNCVFTQFTGAAIDASGGNGYNIWVTNCIIRNIQNPTAWWEGDSFISWATNGDTLVFRNNTFFNNTGHIVNSNWEDAYTNYFEFSHNTVFGGNFNVTASFATTNGVFTDNLIVDSYAMGIDTSGQKSRWVDWDGLTAAIFPIDTNAAVKMMDELGLVEADRRMETHNNAYYWSEAVKNHWASRGAQFPDPVALFMNERDVAMYADDDSYPLLNESNNIEADPMMTDTDMQAEIDAGYAKYGNGLFDSFLPGGAAFEGYLHMYPDGDGRDDVIFFVEWPLAEDLGYTSATLLTHSSTGGPVGALRWHDIGTGVENVSLSSDVELSNYPNPFSVSTTINYTIDHTSEVLLSVYDMVGKEVAVLVNETQHAGSYRVDWDGRNLSGTELPGGVYFYQLRDGADATTKRMIKIQ